MSPDEEYQYRYSKRWPFLIKIVIFYAKTAISFIPEEQQNKYLIWDKLIELILIDVEDADELEEPEKRAPALVYRDIFDALQCPWSEDA